MHLFNSLEGIESDRPGTSFTSKRQIRTQDIKKRSKVTQINVGALDTGPRPTTNQTSYTPASEPQFRKFIFAKVPRVMIQDKEKLYDELLHTKQLLNQYRTDNSKLKTKTQSYEEELNRLGKVVKSDHRRTVMETFYDELSSPTQTPESKSLQVALKRQLKEAQEKVAVKENTISQLMRDQRSTKLRELETENQVIRSELARLTQMLKSSISFQQEGNEDVINTLKNDNIEMAGVLRQQSDTISDLQKRLQQAERRVTKLTHEKQALNNVKVAIEVELRDLKARDPYVEQRKKQVNQIEVALREELDRKFQECNALNNQVMLKDKKCHELDKRLKEMQADFHERFQDWDKEMSSLRQRLQQTEEQLTHAQQSFAVGGKRRTVNHLPSLVLIEANSKSNQNLMAIHEMEDHEDHDEEAPQPRKLPTVSKEDVVDIGKQLRYRLRDQRLQFEDVEKYLIDDVDVITIEILQQNLGLYPFDLTDEEALLLARYLVENNEDRMVLYVPTASTTWPRARSILKNLLGHYTLRDPAEEELVQTQVSTMMKKYWASIEDYLYKLKNTQRKTCTLAEFEDALAFVDTTLPAAALDYLMQKNFFFNHQLNLIDLHKTHDHFCGQPDPLPKVEISPPQEVTEEPQESAEPQHQQQEQEEYESDKPLEQEHQDSQPDFQEADEPEIDAQPEEYPPDQNEQEPQGQEESSNYEYNFEKSK